MEHEIEKNKQNKARDEPVIDPNVVTEKIYPDAEFKELPDDEFNKFEIVINKVIEDISKFASNMQALKKMQQNNLNIRKKLLEINEQIKSINDSINGLRRDINHICEDLDIYTEKEKAIFIIESLHEKCLNAQLFLNSIQIDSALLKEIIEPSKRNKYESTTTTN